MTLGRANSIILSVRNFWRVCSQFWLSVRNCVSGPFNGNQSEILHIAGWEGGGGLRDANFVNKHFVNKLAFPNRCVVTLGESLVVLCRKPLWRNEK